MNILYTSRGIPTLELDGIVYAFNRQNAAFIVGELSTSMDLCNEIRAKVVDSINSIVNQPQLSETSTSQEINNYINNLGDLPEFYIVNDILDESIDNYKQLTTPKPFAKWIWDRDSSQWIAPMSPPEGAPEGAYLWSEEHETWVPAETSPHLSWIWDFRDHKYVPPTSYPLDAQEGEFVWDEEKLSWVVNV